MAAGVGEASAVVQLLQIGFSLATTLTTYIADAKDAPNEISSLATEIDATLRQVEELDILLKENEQTNGWNANGVVLANKCRRDCESVVTKLVGLLRKSGTIIPDGGTIEREDIDLSLFKRVGWLRFKPQVQVVKHELERSRIDMLLARDLYKVKVSPSKEEQTLAKDRLVGLIKRKRRIKAQLHDARREEMARRQIGTRFSSNPPERIDPDTSSSLDEVRRNKTFRQARKEARHRTRYRRTQRSDSDTDISIVDYDEIAAAVREDLVRQTQRDAEVERQDKEAEQEAAREKAALEAENRKAEEAKERKKLEDDTKEQYRKTLAQQVAKYHADLEEQVKEMELAFDPPLPSDQIRHYVEQKLRKDLGGELVNILRIMPMAIENKLSTIQQATVYAAYPRSEAADNRRSTTFGRNTNSPANSEEKYRAGIQAREYLKSIPWDKAILIIVSLDDGQEWCVTRCSAVTPFIQEMVRDSPKKGSGSSILGETLQTYSQMPSDCRTAVEEYLRKGDCKGTDWDLVLVRCRRPIASCALRMIRRLSNAPQHTLQGHAYILLYLPKTDKKKQSDDRPTSKLRNFDSQDAANAALPPATKYKKAPLYDAPMGPPLPLQKEDPYLQPLPPPQTFFQQSHPPPPQWQAPPVQAYQQFNDLQPVNPFAPPIRNDAYDLPQVEERYRTSRRPMFAGADDTEKYERPYRRSSRYADSGPTYDDHLTGRAISPRLYSDEHRSSRGGSRKSTRPSTVKYWNESRPSHLSVDSRSRRRHSWSDFDDDDTDLTPPQRGRTGSGSMPSRGTTFYRDIDIVRAGRLGRSPRPYHTTSIRNDDESSRPRRRRAIPLYLADEPPSSSDEDDAIFGGVKLDENVLRDQMLAKYTEASVLGEHDATTTVVNGEVPLARPVDGDSVISASEAFATVNGEHEHGPVFEELTD